MIKIMERELLLLGMIHLTIQLRILLQIMLIDLIL